MTTTPTMAFPPGDFLAEELEARGWTQTELAEIIGRPAQVVSGIVSGKKEITRDTAAEIGAALGTSAEYWLNLQNSYELWLRAQDPAAAAKLEDVRVRARMNELAPVAVLRKRGYIPAGSLPEQKAALCSLLGIDTLEEEVPFRAAARRHNTDEPFSPIQCAWLACARQDAARLTAAGFDREGLRRLGEHLTRIVETPTALETLPRRFANVGVRLVYVESFPGSRLSGASFSLDDAGEQPVIAISGYGKRLDRIVFTLLHEIAHIVLGHVNGRQVVIDEGLDDESPREKEADGLAGGWALPEPMSPPANVRRPWVRSEAVRQGVHPMIVIGRLQHEGHVDWKTELVRGAPRVDDHLAAWRS